MNAPEVVSRDQWLAERRKLLAKEKELTRAGERFPRPAFHCGDTV